MGEPTAARRDLSVIRLRRQQGAWRDGLRAYQVRVDGNAAGAIAEGEAKDFVVPAGEHRVRLSIDRFFTSREMVLTIGAGELTELTCAPGGSAVWSLLALLRPGRYISLNGPR